MGIFLLNLIFYERGKGGVGGSTIYIFQIGNSPNHFAICLIKILHAILVINKAGSYLCISIPCYCTLINDAPRIMIMNYYITFEMHKLFYMDFDTC